MLSPRSRRRSRPGAKVYSGRLQPGEEFALATCGRRALGSALRRSALAMFGRRALSNMLDIGG